MADNQNKNLASLYVNTFIKAGGATFTKAALQEAFKIADIDAIFSLSDGQPTDATPDDILKEVSTLNTTKKVVIHSIGLGQDKDAVFLQNLATQNGGHIMKVNGFRFQFIR